MKFIMVKLLCWNIREIRSRGSIPYFKSLVQEHKPDIVALLEPMADADLGGTIMETLGYDQFCHGGDMNKKIWIFWRNHINLQLISSNEHYIHCEVSLNSFSFACTFIYAKCRRSERTALWENLINTSESMSIPWIVGGDFNTIAHYSEKKGGTGYDDGAISDFNDFMTRAGLSDPGFKGNSFTWSNNRSGDRCIWERIDRFLFNGWALNALQMPENRHLSRSFSDHCPLLATIISEERRPSRFHYQKIWEQHPGFMSIVTDAWNARSHENPLLNVSMKLKHVREVLHKWNWQVFGDDRRKKTELTVRISLLDY